jgi:hypothetical protein
MSRHTCSLILGLALGHTTLGHTAQARPPGIGVGATLGEPISLTGSYRVDDKLAAQGLLGWSFGQRQLHISVDGVYDLLEIPSDEAMGFSYPVYLGAGLRIRAGHPKGAPSRPGATLGLRLPIGVGVVPDASPVEVFFEIVPVLVFVPVVEGGVDATLGGRVFF